MSNNKAFAGLFQVQEAESQIFQDVASRLGEAATLSDEYARLYSNLADLAGPFRRDWPEDTQRAHLLALHFAAACRYNLTLGTLCVFRGHLGDSMMHSRRATELCAFAALVKRQPHKARAWTQARVGPKEYSAYKEKFGSKHLFPPDHPRLRHLYGRYDFFSKRQHGSIYSIAGHMRYDQSPDVIFDFFDARPDTPEIAGIYFYLLQTHWDILGVFAQDVFHREIAASLAQWNESLGAVRTKEKACRDPWMPAIRAALERSPT